MSDIAIRVQNLGKQYRIGMAKRGYQTLRETISQAFLSPYRHLRKSYRPKSQIPNPKSDLLWALKDVSFEVKQGEVLGIIGRNGAGKSTLLKILARITEPTEGSAEIHGRVGSLLEVGTGFHAELTGRENIYLGGAILGMRKAEIDHQFDEIVAFAEIDDFLDTPMKHYSSGMFVRLAFAVAAHLQTEILLVDEVLAVGDFAFQSKCLGRIKATAQEGRTVLFVTHQMSSVTNLCSRAIQIHKASLVQDGEADAVVRQYLSSAGEHLQAEHHWNNPDTRPGDETFRLHAIRILNRQGNPQRIFGCNESIRVELQFELFANHPSLFIGFDLMNQIGTLVLRSCHNHGPEEEWPELKPGHNRLQGTIPANLLNHGTYYIAPRVALNFIGWIVFGEPQVSFDIQMDHHPSPFWNACHTVAFPGVIAPILSWRASVPPFEKDNLDFFKDNSLSVATEKIEPVIRDK